jgi:hypothetical protein
MADAQAVELVNSVVNRDELVEQINRGDFMIIAADEAILTELPPGNWIGGTIPYFMTEQGGCHSLEIAYVTTVKGFSNRNRPSITLYDQNSIARIAEEAPEQGFTFLLLPNGSDIHMDYAKNAPEYPNMYFSPIVGWICGNSLEQPEARPKTGYGPAGGLLDANKAVAMHVHLPDHQLAQINIINVFEQGDGPTLEFSESGFSAGECLVDGKATNLSHFFKETHVDTRLPLVADYAGVMVNVSVKEVKADQVDFYAPVFTDMKYKIAKPTDDYVATFTNELTKVNTSNLAFSCNCILNYLYGELEGRKTGAITGPMTFGEVAYQLVNQTMVYLTLETQ